MAHELRIRCCHCCDSGYCYVTGLILALRTSTCCRCGHIEKKETFKLKELWAYFANDFENADKHLKKIRKSKKITEYEDAVEKLFSDCEFRI